MDTLKDSLICRLCGINLVEEKCKDILEESADLLHKIAEVLPISISIDDNGSKHVCLSCYDKIILYYKFIQDVAEHSKKLENVSQVKTFFNLSREVTDFSKIHSDAIYTCPNCNVGLMILLVSNPPNCDYTFQIALAMINDSERNHILREKSIQVHNNVINFSSVKKNNIHPKDESKIADTENIKNIFNQVSLTLPVLQQEENTNYVDRLCVKEDLEMMIKNETKSKSEKAKFYDDSNSLSKLQKLEEVSDEFNENILNCKHNSTETLIKTERESNNTYCLDSENYIKSEKDTHISELQDIKFEKDETQEESDIYKSCLKYVCKLCGARYLSLLKYKFHMERHKLDKIYKYECIVCDKEASSEHLLWDHYFHTHKSLQRYICTGCGKFFRKRSRLNSHQKISNHSGVKQIRVNPNDHNVTDDIIQKAIATTEEEKTCINCNLCGKLISDLDPDAINDVVTCIDCEDSTLSLMVDGNETKVISPRQYHCSQCPKHFVRRERLEFHEMRHNENMNEFICSTCGKDFRAENSLYEHYIFVHKGARPHICELCGKSFQLKTRLKEHHRIHTGEKPYQCDVCGQKCRTTNALRLHRKIHFSHNRYTCNICSKSFSKKQNFNEHLEKHWKNDKNVTLPQLFRCPICLENFPTYRMLKYHMVDIHKINKQDPILTKQKPWYECQECHEKFKHQMSLKAHKERAHEGRVDPLYQCDTCNATYRVKQLLVNHIRSKHNGERRYKCAQCEKGFNDTKSLYNHVLLHTGKKPFICEYCNMRFRRKDSRDLHRRRHTGEQPYQCPDCGESFSTYNSRSKHRKREHGEGDPDCPECGEKCNNQQEIRIHLNKHLGEKLQKLQTKN
ncbi:PREDICTED: zinc finger protein 665-like [Dufourea novaeangliae]|uniref:zinc finger protein 665-like n=1 Tax=Dufourea novaeangliae TaxID=178035 RepID=UPI0007675160|nr:PREDICTED: zinc finger protein 665-like [Dufourea novaeangliae]